ncbi:MAG: hypothetical protein FWC23_06745 [Chitinispirillia bacterium]|nr:hypothetical protein [Chitinispirillia bacterium]MCL2268866.1 hypothetical protein [Chitinispirillia bacterium]
MNDRKICEINYPKDKVWGPYLVVCNRTTETGVDSWAVVALHYSDTPERLDYRPCLGLRWCVDNQLGYPSAQVPNENIRVPVWMILPDMMSRAFVNSTELGLTTDQKGLLHKFLDGSVNGDDLAKDWKRLS